MNRGQNDSKYGNKYRDDKIYPKVAIWMLYSANMRTNYIELHSLLQEIINKGKI